MLDVRTYLERQGGREWKRESERERERERERGMLLLQE